MNTVKEDILGYQVTASSLDECVTDIIAGMRNEGDRRWLACLNPHSYALCLKDRAFNRTLRSANWLVPDGAGIVMASWILGGKLSRRITGSDIFYALNERMNELGGVSVFFLGSTSDNQAEIQARMARDYPNVRFAGSYSPPYKSEYTKQELEAMISAINQVKPDVLWVGMTAPKQEKWIHQNFPRLSVRFAAAIGAVFDFYTGRVKRSHPAFQKLGLEWLPRLLQQPQRLWRRTFVSAPIFLRDVLMQKVYPRHKR